MDDGVWEKDRHIRAKLSAIEAVRGTSDEWYRQREHLYQFQFETGFYGRTGTRLHGASGANTDPDAERMHAESDERIGGGCTPRQADRTTEGGER